ncbi:carbon-nitrogen hydrolase family protein [Vibrio sp. JC009]|uniref:carbon-nitrogen hydrolase family protein n=1 Tax=Vibrio sp. JC009 TaxID=2912314 RepID=UPI0023B09AAB|nr:carbon-nitrogen hydrolase family protein [Vibrio sp. JC009]WED21532.1 carbon-nitrogen hydrolase family protein [Vibrio sp. JC009]
MQKVGIIQMTSGPEPEKNLNYIKAQLEVLASSGVSLVLTPENALVFGNKADYHRHAEILGDGPVQNELARLAAQYQIWLVIGSMPIKREVGVTTTTLVYAPDGELAAYYDKLHMFDVDVADNHSRYRESETFASGNRVSLVETPLGRIGLTICYDVRFPHLFSELRHQGANVILVPAAFTATTGKAHWETLLKARAIENQCWIIAAGQGGVHPCQRETWGHSMIIDPWGNIAMQLDQKAGVLVSAIDHNITKSVRANMPLAEHARFTSIFKN